MNAVDDCDNNGCYIYILFMMLSYDIWVEKFYWYALMTLSFLSYWLIVYNKRFVKIKQFIKH